MRIFLGFLCGVLGLVIGWFGIAMLVISTAGMGNDGGIAMSAFFQLGPIGGLVGFVIGAWLFSRTRIGRR